MRELHCLFPLFLACMNRTPSSPTMSPCVTFGNWGIHPDPPWCFSQGKGTIEIGTTEGRKGCPDPWHPFWGRGCDAFRFIKVVLLLFHCESSSIPEELLRWSGLITGFCSVFRGSLLCSQQWCSPGVNWTQQNKTSWAGKACFRTSLLCRIRSSCTTCCLFLLCLSKGSLAIQGVPGRECEVRESWSGHWSCGSPESWHLHVAPFLTPKEFSHFRMVRLHLYIGSPS